MHRLFFQQDRVYFSKIRIYRIKGCLTQILNGMNDLIKPEYEQMIFNFRGLKVMIDADLAMLYGTSTKVLKQQVKRNLSRFPGDFMFELTVEEKTELVTNCDRFNRMKHSTVNPFVFTEQGVAMLSSVLRSEKAIQINIEIMRAFARYRSLLREYEELKVEIKKLDAKVNYIFQLLLAKIDALHEKKQQPRERIGYKPDKI